MQCNENTYESPADAPYFFLQKSAQRRLQSADRSAKMASVRVRMSQGVRAVVANNSPQKPSPPPQSFAALAEEVLSHAQAGRDVIQDFVPLADSLEWELGQQYLRERGNKAFISDASPVPFVINNDGTLSRTPPRCSYARSSKPTMKARSNRRLSSWSWASASACSRGSSSITSRNCAGQRRRVDLRRLPGGRPHPRHPGPGFRQPLSFPAGTDGGHHRGSSSAPSPFGHPGDPCQRAGRVEKPTADGRALDRGTRSDSRVRPAWRFS